MQHAWAITNTSVLYALAGISFSFSYMASRRFNLAHGLVFSFAGYAAVVTTERFSMVSFVAIAVAIALVTTVVVHAIPRPNLAAAPNRQLLYSFGELLLGETLLSMIYGDAVRTPPLLPDATVRLASAAIAQHELQFVLIGIGVLITCDIAFRTGLGLQLRALCDSADRARATGLPQRRLRLILLTISGVCGGCAAAGWAIRFSVEPATGLLALIPSITIALTAISLYEFAVRPIHFASTSVLLTSLTTLVALATSWRWYSVALSTSLVLAVALHAHVRRLRFSDTQVVS